MGKKIMADRTQRILLAVAIVSGIVFADGIILAPVHEWGHLHWAQNIEHVEAHIADWNHTYVKEITPHILMAGYENEILSFLIIYVILFFISSPAGLGIRQYWWHLGLPLAYATWSWLKPLLFAVDDFVRVPEWTAGMRGTLFTEYVVFITIAWLMLFLGRVKRPR